MTQKTVNLEEKVKELEKQLEEKEMMINKLKKELHHKEIQCKKWEYPDDKD